MISDAIKWDKKHKESKQSTKPLQLLENFINLAPSGIALDLACGMGRNARFMRDCGFLVDCVDISAFAIDSLKQENNLNPILADLDNFKLAKNRYSLICNSYFLDRNLFYGINQALTNGGILIFETFIKSEIQKNCAFSKDSKFLLNPNELLRAFLTLEIIYYEEKLDSNSYLTARLVARKSSKNPKDSN